MTAPERSFPRAFWLLVAGVVLISTLPYVLAWFRTPQGAEYLGVHTNLDDHSVYAAWITQSSHGSFLFENRFTTDTQPTLTIHLYFWVLGILAKSVGVSIAMHVGRIVGIVLFLMALYKSVGRCSSDVRTRMIATAVATFAAGAGAFVWTRYGHAGPIDVWQPEAFVFPSLMTNGLFAVSLWLMLVIWNCILDAQNSWRPVAAGALATLVLANIHTYDVLQIALIAIAFLAATVANGRFSITWLVRAVAIALGAVPSIAWFVYVRANDPVFAARAETPTFTPAFWKVAVGLLLLAGTAAVAGTLSAKTSRRSVISITGIVVVWLALAFSTSDPTTTSAISPVVFALVFGAGVALAAAYPARSSFESLLVAWSYCGPIALYYPGLFQRKLAMGLSLPLAVVSGLAVAALVSASKADSIRRAQGLGLAALLTLGSLFWLRREIQMANENLSNTTVHTPILEPEVATIVSHLRELRSQGGTVVAMPGLAVESGKDQYELLVQDLNPIVSGWVGLHTFAGHWSETPNYAERRRTILESVYFSDNPISGLAAIQASYLITPTGDFARSLGINTDALLAVGRPVFVGERWALIRVGD